jgi:cytochrome c553
LQGTNENPSIHEDAERAVAVPKSMTTKNIENRFSIACRFIACVAVAGYAASAAAQNTTIMTGNVDDLRPLYADSGDISEGKRLVDSSCAGCHGANGISESPDVPHLAGQRPAYLYLELRAYQSGVRGDSAMNNAVKFLNDDALVKVAAYFASLDPPQTRPASGTPAVVTKPDAVQIGKTAAAACAGCHGEAGVTKTPGMPNLAGLDPKYLVGAMNGYKSGLRKNDLMKSMLAAVSGANVDYIALYFALQKPEPAKTPAPGDQAAGKTAAAACAGCHGEQGVSAIPTTPSLAGQDAQYIAAALAAYKDDTRNNETMKGLATALDDAAIKNLAAFYAHQQPLAPDVRKPLTTQEWAQRCDRCHGQNGNSTNPRLPALAGQRTDYLIKVLHAYRTGARKSPEMAAMSEVLTENDIENLSAYYAAQKTRPAVYVVTPATAK